MKRFSLFLVSILLIIGIVTAAHADNWSLTVETGPDNRVILPIYWIPLTVDNFTVSSIGQVSNLAYNDSIAELSFDVNVSASEANVEGSNVNLTIPESIADNSSLVLNVCVDGKGNGFILFEPSTLGFFLSEGSHTVTLQIGVDPPVTTIPEFQVSVLMLTALFSAVFAVVLKKVRGRKNFSVARAPLSWNQLISATLTDKHRNPKSAHN